MCINERLSDLIINVLRPCRINIAVNLVKIVTEVGVIKDRIPLNGRGISNELAKKNVVSVRVVEIANVCICKQRVQSE